MTGVLPDPLGAPKWLTRQLPDAPATLRIEAFAMHARGPGGAAALNAVRDDPMVVVPDPAKTPKSFRVAQVSPAGAKRGTGRGAFVDSLLDAQDGPPTGTTAASADDAG